MCQGKSRDKNPRDIFALRQKITGILHSFWFIVEIFLSEEYAAYEYFDADENKNYTAQNTSLALKFIACFFADENSRHADNKCYNGDERHCNERLCNIRVCECKSCGKSVDRSCDTLNDESTKCEFCAVAVAIEIARGMKSVINHFTADKTEENERNPRNE